jgi:hypothetical protein
VRLADDALGAVESSQRKLEELSQRTESGLEVLRVDVTGLRAELAGITCHEHHAGTQSKAGLTSVAFADSGPVNSLAAADVVSKLCADEAASAIGDAVERRLGARLGQQVLQLSEVLRRVVQAQQTLHLQYSGGVSPHVAVLAQMPPVPPQLSQTPLPSVLPQAVPSIHAATPTVATISNGDAHRRAAIDELYEELRRLEDCDATVKHNSSRKVSPSPGVVRRPRSSRAVTCST